MRPAEDPAALMEEFDRCADRFEELVCRINLTNSETLVDGEPLTALLARRDALKSASRPTRTWPSAPPASASA